jgi:hypothetical protein
VRVADGLRDCELRCEPGCHVPASVSPHIASLSLLRRALTRVPGVACSRVPPAVSGRPSRSTRTISSATRSAIPATSHVRAGNCPGAPVRPPETPPQKLAGTRTGDFAHLPADNKAERSRRVEQGLGADGMDAAREVTARSKRRVAERKAMSTRQPILVTGAAGQVGGIGGLVVSILLERQVPVRAFVRRDDDRAHALRRAGAEIFVGDLTRTEDIARALDTCRRVYFGMSVSSSYLEAAVGMGAAAREKGDVEVLVNMSQMTVSQMSLRNMTDSRQQRQHWLAEQALNWIT